MGTNIYGSYDELVIERTWRHDVRVRVDDVWRVRVVDRATLVSWPGERVLEAGRRRSRRVLVLDLVSGAAHDRLLLAVADPDGVAADLRRSGIGVDRSSPVPLLATG